MEKSQGRGNARWVSGLFLPLVSALLLICASQEAAAAGQHQVGGTPGWSLPSRANVSYTTWASTQTFSVGDTLYFNYSKEFHNVLQVTEANYNNCSASSPISTWDDGETIVQLNTSGTLYFLCGITGHCEQGQKVAVLIQAASSSSSSTSSPAPKNTATPPSAIQPASSSSSSTSSPAPKNTAAPPSASTLLRLSSLLALSLIFILHLLP